VVDCAKAHEDRHLVDIRGRGLNCYDIPYNEKRLISASSLEEKIWTEENAYREELKCLKSKLKKLCTDDRCSVAIEERVLVVIQKLDQKNWN
jgi:hypothetical protein